MYPNEILVEITNLFFFSALDRSVIQVAICRRIILGNQSENMNEVVY